MPSQEWSSFNGMKLNDYPARDTFITALKVGTFTGASGLCVGGVSSILLATKTPTLFTAASGIQWFLLGSTFWATRSTLLHSWTPSANGPFTKSERIHSDYPSPRDRVYASTIAGGITGGTIGGLLRGRKNVLPATLLFTVFGYAGQSIYNGLDARHSEQVAVATAEATGDAEVKRTQGFWQKVAGMKWSPMVSLTEDEYARLLKEKCLAVEAEIALVREQVTTLNEQRKIMSEERTTALNESDASQGAGDRDAGSKRQEP